MSFRRMLPFILINVIVSTVVVLSILYWWENRGGTEAAETAAATPSALTEAAQTTPGAAAPEAAVPAPTATLEPEDEMPVHVVQAGDTLSSLATIYGVPMDDIMTANGMSNADIISVGQQLLIPINGLPTATPLPEPTEETAVLPSPIATEPLPQGDVQVEISQVLGVGDLVSEAVQIRNVGSNPVALQDWKLVDDTGNFYTFGQVTLFGDGAGVLVHSDAGQNSPTEFFWGASQAMWEPGELVTLLDAQGEIAATYTIP